MVFRTDSDLNVLKYLFLYHAGDWARFYNDENTYQLRRLNLVTMLNFDSEKLFPKQQYPSIWVLFTKIPCSFLLQRSN